MKYGLNERTGQNSRKRTKQNRDSQSIRCRGQKTGDQDAQRTQWVQQQYKRRNEDYTKWNKNLQGANSEGKEPRIQLNNLEHKEEINIQPEQKEEKRIQKHEDRLRNLWDNFKHTNIWIIGAPEGEEEKQEIQNLFEKIMKENILNLVKEIDIQVQEAQSSKQVGPKEDHTKTHQN